MQASCIYYPHFAKTKNGSFSLITFMSTGPMWTFTHHPNAQPSPSPVKASPTKVGNLDLAWDPKIRIFRFVSFTAKETDSLCTGCEKIVLGRWLELVKFLALFDGTLSPTPPGWANSRWQKALVSVQRKVANQTSSKGKPKLANQRTTPNQMLICWVI